MRRLGVFLICLTLLLAPAKPSATRAAPQSFPTRQVFAPHFDGGVRFNETAVFWFGRITATENYADVRVGYNDSLLYVHLTVFDRRLWYEERPVLANLHKWDAVTLYLDTDGNTGTAPDAHSVRLVAQLTWWESPRNAWQSAYRGNGTGWVSASLPFTTTAGWRGDAPLNNVDDRGWTVAYEIPFSSLGLTGAPAHGTGWGLAVALHDRDDAAGTPIADKVWPEGVAFLQPATWGQLVFGLPTYTPPPATLGGMVTIRHGLNGTTVTDGAVGGGTDCGYGLDYWTEWGNTPAPGVDVFNVQNQGDVADWPCFAKYYVTFPLAAIPANRAIISATLTLHQTGNAGQGWVPGPVPSVIQVLTVAEDWTEATLTWNNAPLALANGSQSWVAPLDDPGWPGVPRTWDVSGSVAVAYAAGEPLRLAVYAADWAYHSGRYFVASDAEAYYATSRPTLRVTWGQPTQQTNTLALAAGWNLIALPLAPANTAVTVVLSSIAGRYDAVYAYDPAHAPDPWRTYPGDLSDIDETMGLWIHTTQATTLTVTGTVPGAPAIALAAGWNLVGYPWPAAQPVAAALASCAGSYDLVYAYDTAQPTLPWRRFRAASPPAFNSLTEMQPGLGYWIRATAPCVWTMD